MNFIYLVGLITIIFGLIKTYTYFFEKDLNKIIFFLKTIYNKLIHSNIYMSIIDNLKKNIPEEIQEEIQEEIHEIKEPINISENDIYVNNKNWLEYGWSH